MPAEAPDEAAREGVERPDEHRVERETLPAAMEARLHRKALLDKTDFAKAGEHRAELRRAVSSKHRCVLVLERDLHHFREGVQPRNPVVDLEDGVATRLEHAPTFLNESPAVGCVL